MEAEKASRCIQKHTHSTESSILDQKGVKSLIETLCHGHVYTALLSTLHLL